MNNMQHKGFSFNMDRGAHMIVEALRQALEIVMPDIMVDNGFQERNGYGQFRWNAIIGQLRDKCQHLGWLDFAVCKRGAWKTPVLFHFDTKYLLTFMTEETFSNVQRRKEKGKHYLCGGASFNNGLVPQTEQIQMELPPVDKTYGEWIAKSREQLASALEMDEIQIKGHILIIFDVKNDTLLSVRAVRLTQELAISTEEENWSKFIRVPFNTSEMIKLDKTEEDTEELVELI